MAGSRKAWPVPPLLSTFLSTLRMALLQALCAERHSPAAVPDGLTAESTPTGLAVRMRCPIWTPAVLRWLADRCEGGDGPTTIHLGAEDRQPFLSVLQDTEDDAPGTAVRLFVALLGGLWRRRPGRTLTVVVQSDMAGPCLALLGLAELVVATAADLVLGQGAVQAAETDLPSSQELGLGRLCVSCVRGADVRIGRMGTRPLLPPYPRPPPTQRGG